MSKKAYGCRETLPKCGINAGPPILGMVPPLDREYTKCSIGPEYVPTNQPANLQLGLAFPCNDSEKGRGGCLCELSALSESSSSPL
jgi:hypothetical protein